MMRSTELSPSLRQLEQFIAVAEELHFGRAALRLHMHQAPLSQAIQKLELSLGLQLFERTHRSVALTPAGAILLEYARDMVWRGREFTRIAQGLSRGERGRLVVGFVSTAMYGSLPEVVRAFTERYPKVDLQLREATSDLQLGQLETGDIDIGLILGELPRGMEAIRSRVLGTDGLVVVVPASWNGNHLAKESSNSIDLELLRDRPLVTIPRQISPPLYEAILECFRVRGLEPRFGQEGIQMQTIVGLVAAGLGYAIVPESMRLLARPDARFFAINGGTPRIELQIAWRTSDPNPLTHSFIRFAFAKASKGI